MIQTKMPLIIIFILLIPLIMLPFSFDWYNPPKHIYLILISSLFFYMFCLRKIKTETNICYNIVSVLFFVFLLLCSVSFIWSKNFVFSIKDLGMILSGFLIYITLLNFDNKEKLLKIALNTSAIAAVVVSIYTLFQYFGTDFIVCYFGDFPDWRFHLPSTFGNPNPTAYFLILIFPVIFIKICLVKNSIVEKVIFSVVLSVIFAALLCLFSIVAFFSLALSLLLLTFFGIHFFPRDIKNHFRKNISFILAIFTFLFLIFSTVNILNKSSIFEKAYQSKVFKEGFKNRVLIWQTCLFAISDNPVLGCSIGNFQLVYPIYRGKALLARAELHDSTALDHANQFFAHNEFLQFFVETGVFGFIAFVLLIVTILRVAFRKIFLENQVVSGETILLCGFYFGIVAICVSMMFDFPLHNAAIVAYFWFFAALVTDKEKQLFLGLFARKFLQYFSLVVCSFFVVVSVFCYISDIYLNRLIEKGYRENLSTENILNYAYISCVFNPYSDANIYLGNFHIYTEDYKKATDFYLRALHSNENIDLNLKLAYVLEKRNNYNDATKYYEKAVLMNPLSAKLREYLAWNYYHNGFKEMANDQAKLVLKAEPTNETIKTLLRLIEQES